MRFLYAFICLAIGLTAQAQTSLSFTGTNRVLAGDFFDISAYVDSTDPLTGVDYYLMSSTPGFSIADRYNTSLSQFSDLTKPNNGGSGVPGVLDPDQNKLVPTNGQDLGATIVNVSNAVSGHQFLASYRLAVDPSIPTGDYTITSYSLPGSGWVGSAPFFNEGSFTPQASFAIHVTGVPEPTSVALGSLAVILVLKRKAQNANGKSSNRRC